MAKYRITAPDGGTYEVTAPDDATQEQVLAYAQQNYQQPEAAAAPQAQANTAERPIDPSEGGSTLQFATPWKTYDTGIPLSQGVTRGLAGLGKSAVDTVEGIGQLTGMVDTAAVDERRKLDAPLMSTGAGLAGNLIGQVAQIGVPVGGLAKGASFAGRAAPYVGAAARAGTFSAAQGVGEGESRAGNAAQGAAWGVAGQGVASGLGKMAASAKEAISPAVRQSIESARAAGIPLHLSQVTDSRFLKGASAVLNNLPFTGASKAAGKQQEAFNRAVSRSFGADASLLTDDVMKAARQRIGHVYDDVFARNEVGLTQLDLGRMAQIEKAAIQDMTADQSAVVSRQFQKIIDDFADGKVSGDKYQSLRGSLSDAADQGQAGKAIKALRKALDDAAFRSVGGADAKALKRANSMWANMRTTQDALKQVSGASGNVRPASLWPLVRKGSTPEMRELAKVGQNVLKKEIANSGTPERELIYRLLGLGGAGTLGGIGLPALGQTALLGMGAGRAMNSPLVAMMLGQGKPINALARAAKPAPRLLPAAANASGLSLDISGGRKATPAEIAADEEIVRRSKGGR